MNMKKSPIEVAAEVKLMAEKLGWSLSVRGTIVTITKCFMADSNDEFCKADSEYYSILGLLPQTSPGSVWGTDGSGIGALSAIKTGRFVMNKSGVSKRVLKYL
jgi:hypothetical protein